MTAISLNLNGRRVAGEVEPRTHLADFIRDALDLTGTHLGCEHGVCGACTLLLDGVPARSCITYAVACDGAEVTTIEGLDDDELTRELREAFTREHALQCGYCTPGMLVSARDLALRLPDADEHEIRVAMSGNLCRCTGYVGIIRAVKAVVAERRARGIAPLAGAGRDALGPVGSGHAGATASVGASTARRRRSPEPTPAGAEINRASFDPGWTPQASFDQSFMVPYPRAAVWDMFGRIEDVAACLPGAALSGVPSAEHAEGQIRVKVGPISAEFRGVAEIERDETAFSGRIQGQGSDARSNSATRGRIDYRLVEVEAGTATRVEVTVGYTLTGVLAQFGRSGLVQDVAGRLTAAFAANLERRLAGGAQPGAAMAEAPELNGMSLILAVIGGRLRSMLRRLARRS